MSNPLEIVPSILTGDPIELRDMIEKCEGVVERISVDIIDGKFVDNKTIEPDLLFDLDTNLMIDYQLMVVEPVHWIEKCIRGQAERIIGHIESMSSQIDFAAKAQEVGSLIGLALNIETSVSELDKTLLADLDVVLLMSSKVGYGGQPFNIEVLKKIKELVKLRSENNCRYKIHVDGGINESSIYNVYKEGADEVSIGKRLFEGDLNENIDKLKNLLKT